MNRRVLVDVVPALLLAAWCVVEVLTLKGISGPPVALVASALAITLPLAARRRAPLAVLVLIFAVVGATDQPYGIVESAVSPLGAMLLAVYASSAYACTRGDVALSLVVLALFVGFLGVLDGPGDLLFVGVLMAGPWIAGRVVNSRQQLTSALAARTVELEHEREEKAKVAVAEERARIARELHDVVAHSVSVMVVQAGAERRAVAADRPETAEVLDTIEQTGRAALAEMRRLLGMLRRSDDDLALAPQPTLRALDDLVGQVRAAGMPVELRIEGERRPLPTGVDLSAYRIVQEALTNALKHAGPASARVVIRYARDAVDVEVADDGDAVTAGAAANGTGGGHGLVGMRERVALFGGDLSAGRRMTGGFAVRARLPVPPAERP